MHRIQTPHVVHNDGQPLGDAEQVRHIFHRQQSLSVKLKMGGTRTAFPSGDHDPIRREHRRHAGKFHDDFMRTAKSNTTRQAVDALAR